MRKPDEAFMPGRLGVCVSVLNSSKEHRQGGATPAWFWLLMLLILAVVSAVLFR